MDKPKRITEYEIRQAWAFLELELLWSNDSRVWLVKAVFDEVVRLRGLSPIQRPKIDDHSTHARNLV